MPRIAIDFNPQSKFVRPELLQHPPLPPCLGGVNPRTVKGREWWDTVRHPVYKENNYCCWACGQYADPLHAHEAYEFDFESHTASLEEIVGLCIPCHRFIHIAMTFLRHRHLCKEALAHGRGILSDAGLEPHWMVDYVAYIYENPRTTRDEIVDALELDTDVVDDWIMNPDWKMVIDGNEYDRHSKPIREARIERRRKRWGL